MKILKDGKNNFYMNKKIRTKRIKKLINESFFYSIGQFLTKSISFFLISFYTRCFSPQEYGQLEIIINIVVLLVPFVSLNLQESVYRFCIENKKEEIYILNVSLKLIIKEFIFLFFPVLILGLIYEIKIFLVFLNVLFLTFFLSFKQFYRGTGKLKKYIVLDIYNEIIVFLFVILFCGFLKFGIKGVLYARNLSLGIIIIILMVKNNVFSKMKLFTQETSLYREMILYSIPLIPNCVLWWISNLSDRYFLSFFIGLSATGIYSVANKIPTILNQVNLMLIKAWQTSAISEEKSNDFFQYDIKIFKLYYSILSVFSSLLIVFNKKLLLLLIGEEFISAWKYIPLLILGFYFLSLASFAGVKYTVNKKTNKILKSSLICAIVNIVLNFVLIPKFKIYGAVVATTISYFLLFLIRYKENYFNNKIDLRLVAIIIVLFLQVNIFIFNRNFISNIPFYFRSVII